MTAFSVRRAVVLVAALCMALLGLLGSAPAVSASPDKPSDQQTGLSEFGSCLSGGGKGSLVMLMDQSGSLQKTDPDKARVTAAQYLAARLASFSTTKGITLDVRVAGFASSYAGAGDWTSLTPDALETVKSQISAVGDDPRGNPLGGTHLRLLPLNGGDLGDRLQAQLEIGQVGGHVLA